ncbi:uncharacterized protein C4orf54-like [Stigmatopora nigra]
MAPGVDPPARRASRREERHPPPPPKKTASRSQSRGRGKVPKQPARPPTGGGRPGSSALGAPRRLRHPAVRSLPAPPAMKTERSRAAPPCTGDTAGRTSDLGTDSDGDGAVPSEDGSHYISAGAVRLSELSHDDDDSDPGAGSLPSTDVASPEGDGAPTTPRVPDVGGLRESHPRARFGAGGRGGRQVRLSIKATSRAINDPLRENTLSRAKDAGDISPPPIKGARHPAAGRWPSEESPGRSACACGEPHGVDKLLSTAGAFPGPASNPRGIRGRSAFVRPEGSAASRSTPRAEGRALAEEKEARAAGVASTKDMEDGHKKAVFASSVIQNVLSKKMQFEQERRMERGEVREPRRRAQGPQRAAPGRHPGHDRAGATDPLPPEHADAKRGSAEAPRAALLAGQNSALGRRGDRELGFPREGKKTETQEAREGDVAGGARVTQMSHLFVPTLKRAAGGGDERRRRPLLPSDRASHLTTPGEGVGVRQSPGIQIRLQSRQTGAPPIARHPEGLHCPPASPDTAPAFPLAGVGEGKGKLQTCIHHVRDVRQLVKSSRHFVSPDGKSQPSGGQAGRPTSLSPIVIRCQSVNTHGGKWDRTSSHPSCKSWPEGPPGTEAVASGAERKPAASTTASTTADRVSRVAGKPPASDGAALEKLRAAVKTMERLYVLDKNQWKRKSAPQPRADSHVLSLIASEEPTSPVDQTHAGTTQSHFRQTAPRAGEPRDGPAPRWKVPARGRKASPSIPAGGGGGRRCPTPPDTVPEWSELATSFGVYPSRSSVALGENPSGDPDWERHEHPALPPESQPSASSPPASIYHPWPWAVAANGPQVYYISPAVAPAPPPSPLSATRAKMLLDPASGSYYLVDTPIQAPTRRLLDPETGLFVEVPLPPPAVTPVAPLALSSAAYGHAYVIYPGFVTSPPVTSAQTPPDPAAVPDAVGRRGPWMVAPPSFDGTTVSFVLEHR